MRDPDDTPALPIDRGDRLADVGAVACHGVSNVGSHLGGAVPAPDQGEHAQPRRLVEQHGDVSGRHQQLFLDLLLGHHGCDRLRATARHERLYRAWSEGGSGACKVANSRAMRSSRARMAGSRSSPYSARRRSRAAGR